MLSATTIPSAGRQSTWTNSPTKCWAAAPSPELDEL